MLHRMQTCPLVNQTERLYKIEQMLSESGRGAGAGATDAGGGGTDAGGGGATSWQMK
jgi:uncharacterized membrane protein YgcG